MWDSIIYPTFTPLQGPAGPLQNPPLSGPSILTGTPPRVYPLQGTASSLAHGPVFLYHLNSPGPLLANIVLFGLPLKALKPSARERFSHPYKGCFILLPDQCQISHT